MTYPPHLSHLTPETVPLGRPAFRSWILLFGLVPVDYDDITLVGLEPGRGFLEISRMLSTREWRHRRTVLATGEGCVVRDEITLVPRWPWLGWLQAWVYQRIFEQRHCVLRRVFGTANPRAAADR